MLLGTFTLDEEILKITHASGFRVCVGQRIQRVGNG